jgi:hypothetical protein
MKLASAIQLPLLAVMLGASLAVAQAHDAPKFPDWSGHWRSGPPNRWDPAKPPGRGQEAPLTPEYQAIFEASMADQAAGGPGNDPSTWCYPAGMPRMMTAIFSIEFINLPGITHILSETHPPRRIYTDGRSWPANLETLTSFAGYSIGQWVNPDKDGHVQELRIETRGFKGPRNYEPTGLPLHFDNETIIKERILLDPSDPALLKDEITTIDHALTRPWTVTKIYRRQRNQPWLHNDCTENSQHVRVGSETYYISGDGFLMPVKRGQQPPDARYFK